MTIPDVFVEIVPGAGPFDPIGETYSTYNGTVEGSPSTPDSTSYTTLRDMDIRFDAECDWGRTFALVGKWDGGGVGATSDMNDRTFVFWVRGEALIFSWSEDGTNNGSASTFSYTDTSFTTLQTGLGVGRNVVRVSFDADNGAGGATSTFYTGETLDGPWTQYGVAYSSTATGTVTMYDSTTELRIGEILHPDNAMPFVGKLHGARIYSGTNANTTLANPQFDTQPHGTTQFTDAIGKVWTLGDGSGIFRYDWEDISEDVIAASWAYGRDDELEHFPAGEATVVLYNDDRKYDPEYSAGTYYGYLNPRVQMRILSASLGLSNASLGALNAGTPDHASYAVSDVDVRVHVALDDYTPTLFGRFLVSQYGAAGNIGWSFGIHTDGTPLFIYSTDGTATVTVTGSATVGIANLDPIWFRCAFDAAAGTSNETSFYTSTDGESWTQVGTTSTRAGNVTIFNSTAPISTGATLAPGGYFYEMDYRASVDSSTKLTNPKFYAQAVGATTFMDEQSRVWSVAGSASYEFNDRYKLDQFYGFVENGWEQQLYPPKGANCQVRLVDKLGVLTGYTMMDVMDTAIMASGPVGYWVLDGPSGTETVADKVTPAHDGSVEGNAITFGEQPIGPGHPQSARMAATTSFWTEIFGRVVTNSSPINTNSTVNRSVVITFRCALTSSLNYSTLFIESDGFSGTFRTGVHMYVDDINGYPSYSRVDNGLGTRYYYAHNVLDGEGHIFIGTSAGVYLDSDTLVNTTTTGVGAGGQGVGIGGLSGIADVDHFNGWIGAAALFGRSLGVGDAGFIVDGFNKLDGYTSDQQIEWALVNLLDAPTDQLNFDQGYVTMGTAQTADRDLLEWIREVTATEGGAFYVDHRDGGKLRFTNRYHRFTETRSTTAQAIFSDDPSASFFDVTRVERDDLEIAPNGIDGITNQIAVGWRGGDLVVSDTASIAQYGPRPRQLPTQATVAAVARSAGEWVLAKYMNPQLRVKQLRIYPGASVTAFKPALNLEINDRVRYRSHPQMVGSAIERELYIDGISHTVERGVDWKTVYRLAPADVFTPWIWDESAWDTSTYWG